MTVIGIGRVGTLAAAAAMIGALITGSPAAAADVDWGGPLDLSTSGGNAQSPQIAASADGRRLAVVWVRSTGINYIVRAATSTSAGANWSTPTTLSNDGQLAAYPQIVASADGSRLNAVWYRYNGSNYIVQAATSTNTGATWSTPANLSAIGRDAYDPQIAASADGSRLTAVWYRSNGPDYIVQTATSTDAGGTWGLPVDLSALGRYAYYPQIAASADGSRLTAVWYRDNGTNLIVQAASGRVPPGFAVDPAQWDYGQVRTGGQADKTFTVTNTGSGPLTVSGVGLDGTDAGQFAITGQTCQKVPASGTCQVTLAFAPNAEGAKTAQLVFTDDASGSPQQVALSGTATAPVLKPVKPTHMNVKRKKHKAIVRWQAVSGATSYQVKLGKQTKTVTATKAVLKKLKPGKKYTVKVTAVNSAGKSPAAKVKIEKSRAD